MKNIIKISLFLSLLMVLFAPNLDAQEEIKVPLSNPDEPGLLKIHVLEGGIEVQGYDGDEVLVTIIDEKRDIEKPEYKEDKGRKMRKLSGAGGGYHIEEDKNTVQIVVKPWTDLEKIIVKVPQSFSLNLNCTNDGDIKVSDVDGELDINNINGGVELLNVIGPVVAHALNDNIRIVFKEIPEYEDMSITSLNGDIEVTFPEDTDVDISLKTDNGEVLSDFPIEMKYSTKVSKERSKKGKYKISGENQLSGKINDGGGEIRMQTMNGDIVILKGK